MPRIPTRDKLRQGVPRSTGGIVSAPRDFVSPVMQRTGKQLFEVAGKQAARQQQQEKVEQQRSALELASARSQWTSSLLAEQKSYTRDQNPDYDRWSKTFETRAAVWQKQAAQGISDPRVRQQFMAETQDDLAQVGISIGTLARETGLSVKRAEADRSLVRQVDIAASQPDEDGKAVMGGVRATLQDMVDTGVVSVEEAAGRSVGYAQQYASVKIAEITKQDPALAVSILRGEQPGPAGLIRQLHRFRSTPYWHGHSNRAGYGSDTVTREDGTVEKVVPGMTVSRADADRDVNRRADQFLSGVDKQIGGKVFDRLAPHLRAALVSVGYREGYLPDKVAEAVKSGDMDAIAAAIAADGDEDGGVNRQVRLQEAAILRGEGATPYEQIARRPAWADVLDPVQKSDLLEAADRELEHHDSRRALADRIYTRQLGQGIRSDIRSAFSNGRYADIDPDHVLRELGPEKHRQWLDARQDAASVAAKTQNMPSLPDEQIMQLVEAYRPEPGDDGFARRQAVYERVSRQASEIRRERRDNPVRAAMRVPSVRHALSEAQDLSTTSPQKVQALVREMMATQSALGVAKASVAPVPDEWAFEIGKALTRIPTELDNSKTDDVAATVRQMNADISEQYGEFADDVIAYSIGKARALSSDMARHVGALMKSLTQRRSLGKIEPKSDR